MGRGYRGHARQKKGNTLHGCCGNAREEGVFPLAAQHCSHNAFHAAAGVAGKARTCHKPPAGDEGMRKPPLLECPLLGRDCDHLLPRKYQPHDSARRAGASVTDPPRPSSLRAGQRTFALPGFVFSDGAPPLSRSKSPPFTCAEPQVGAAPAGRSAGRPPVGSTCSACRTRNASTIRLSTQWTRAALHISRTALLLSVSTLSRVDRLCPMGPAAEDGPRLQ
jgi:hypothetical protein